jgi:hypothetical protein
MNGKRRDLVYVCEELAIVAKLAGLDSAAFLLTLVHENVKAEWGRKDASDH